MQTFRISTPFVLAVFACSVAAQADEAPGLPADAPVGMELVDRKDLERHARYLASDELGGRYTTTAGQLAAAEYIASHFESLGLKPLGDKRSFVQHYPVVCSYLEAKQTKLRIAQRTFEVGFAVIPGKDTKRVSASGFVFAEHGAPESFPPGIGRGVPVIVARTRAATERGAMTARRDLLKFGMVAKEAADRGARALVVCLLEDDGGIADALNYDALLPGKPILGYGNDGKEVDRPHPIPLVFVNREISTALLDAMSVKVVGDGFESPRRAKASGRLDLAVKVDRRATATNVVAVLEGDSLAKEAVVFSAHMDHMGTRLDGDPFNGADDNASGTSGLLEIAEAFAKASARPKRSVVFLAVSGEELGLWGSRYWSENPTWPLARVVADINIDMIGRDGDIATGSRVSATPSHRHAMFSTLVQDAARFASRLGLELTVGDKYYARSDHYNFAEKGVPVVFFCDGEHVDYHRVTDHADKLDFPKMERIARLAYWTGRAVADSTERPRVLGERSGWS
ncbi:MAG: M20/M25/M40 family metallo-hydrolase, partial [Planctomycetes bacterium]|nr:M20/M25/M40 family metallo-hydrolase [Planctomycetota bacterium]